MKEAYRSKKVYIIGSVLLVIGLGIPFGIFGITLIPSLNAAPFPYVYLLWAFALLYLLIGFTWADLRGASWRRKNKCWSDDFPDELKVSMWKVRLTFFLPCLVIFVVCIVFEIIHLIAGAYPMLGF